MPAIYGAFNNDESPVGRALTTAAHLMLWGIALLAALRIPYYLGYTHWTQAVASVIALTPVLCGILHHHLTRLCVRCMQEVPADASQRAQREQGILRLNHWWLSNTGTLLYCALVIISGALITRYGLPRITKLPVDLVTITYMYSLWLHHKLRPWCPYCRRWDDGDGMREPSPDPMIKATK